MSYCLKHGLDGDLKVGYGCSWGVGAGSGNGGFKKGVEIEANMDVLTIGQDPIDIKHIHDEAWLIEGAKDFMMTGVADEADRLLNDVLASENDARDAALVQARKDLEDALHKRLWEMVGEMDDKERSLAEELRDAEYSAIASVSDWREGREAYIDNLRMELLWDIKELVWKLGYSQGYHYGAHDGHDAELMSMITAKKDKYASEIQNILDLMEARVAQETAEGKSRNDAAIDELNQLQSDFINELESLIASSTDSLNASIASGDGDCVADQMAAKDALAAFIAERMAIWQSKYDAEEANAKWQQDSYYRFSLLRLLNAKQAAIDAAVQKTNEDFNAVLAGMKQDQNAGNAAQREIWANFTSDLRQQLADAIKANDEQMLATVTEREESLAKRLAEQQQLLQDAMDADKAEMKKNLKEVYNFNSHDIVEAKKSSGQTAPYNHEQHQAFLYKLAYYMKDQLAQMDVGIANMAGRYAASVTSASEAAADENRDSQEKITDLRDASEKALSRLSASLIEEYGDRNSLEIDQLKGMRDAAIAATGSKVEEIRKNVIYAMHVLRYGGGKDALNTGFGKGASSYLGLGNSLTGIDTLDNFRLANPHGYNLAQVSDKINSDDEHFSKLQAMLSDSKAEFDTVIQAQRDDFAAIV